MTQDKITEFANEVKSDITNGEYGENDYCIIVTTCSDIMQTNVKIRNVYKNVAEFEIKALEHIKGIDTIFGINVTVYKFD